MKLTSKQRLFADEYIKSGNATEAYIKAGYSVKTNSSAKAASSRLLTNVNLKTYIDAKMAEIESHKIADAKEVLQFYTRVLRKDETEPEKVMRPDGSEKIVDREPSLKDRLSAAKELMKRYPLNDPLVAAQLKKLQAEADTAEWKRNELTGDNANNESTTLVDDIGGIDDDDN